MTSNPCQPRESDAVLGKQASISAEAVVLGGLDGVKKRLASPVLEQQVAALKEALKYGEAGLKLVILALENESRQVRWAAHQLLGKTSESQIRQVIQKHTPWQLMKCLYTLEDWQIYSQAITPDGQTLVSGSWDKTVKVWNLQTGEVICTLKGHSDVVRSVVISPDGQTIVSASDNYTMKVWGIENG